MGQQQKPIGFGLGDKHAVERVFVGLRLRISRQRLQCADVPSRHGQLDEPSLILSAHKGVAVDEHLEGRVHVLDLNLPGRGHAVEQLVGRIFDEVADLWGQPRAIVEGPQYKVGIQEQPHCSTPNSAAISSSCSEGS